MAITYTNNAKAVSDGLKTILLGEFTATYGSPNMDIVIHNVFEPGRLARKGEYVRIGLEGSPFVSLVSDGEYRDYVFGIYYYIDLYKHGQQREWEDYLSDRMEHIRKLIMNNYYYTSGGSYVWHQAQIEEMTRPQALNETEEELEEGFENVRVIKLTVKITRGNFS